MDVDTLEHLRITTNMVVVSLPGPTNKTPNCFTFTMDTGTTTRDMDLAFIKILPMTTS